MFTVMVIFHTLVCILLVISVLMQSSKGEGLAGAFGGGGGLAGAVFGGRGAASFLSKATTVLAIVFMMNCGVLAYMSSHRAGRTAETSGESAVTREAAKELERQAQQQQQQAPVSPDQSGGQTTPAGSEQIPPTTPEGGK